MLMLHSRHRLRRLASQESVNTRRAHQAVEPEPMPLDPPVLPDIYENGQQDIEWRAEIDNVPEEDLTIVWEEVLRVRPPLDIEDKPDTSLQGTNDAGSFISANESERTDHTEDGDIVYDPATGGLSPDSMLREQFMVDVAKNGEYYDIILFKCMLNV
jgi:hypothetical protein